MIEQVETDGRAVLLGGEAQDARLIVCERTGRWALALRRELDDEDVRIVQTRSLQACWAALAESPGGIAVVEVTAANVGRLLRRMARLESALPLAGVVVVADRSLGGYQWLLREAGAMHFTCSIRQLGPVARLVRRHLAQAPVSERSVREGVWAELPWGRK